jgi:hypothetical protein
MIPIVQETYIPTISQLIGKTDGWFHYYRLIGDDKRLVIELYSAISLEIVK